MTRKIVKSDNAPAPIGPYNQAVAYDAMIFTSGQIAIDPKTGELISGGIEDQTRLVMENLKAVLISGETSLENVLKTTIYLKDMNDFVKVNAIYGEYFTSDPPARSTIEVSRLPKDVLIEIDCIAVKA